MGLTAHRKPAKDFLLRFTNLDFLHPDCVRSEQLKAGFRTFVNEEESIKIGLDSVYEKDNSGQFKIHVAPVYNREKANLLRDEKKNIADVLNKMKEQGKIRKKFEDQLIAELEADYIAFADHVKNGLSSEVAFGWFLEEVERFYRVTGCSSNTTTEQFAQDVANYSVFLLSPYHDVLPYIWIRAILWTHLMQRQNKIKESDNLDVQWASAYLPYIDYAVTDKDFCKSLKETGLAEQYQVKVYSLDLLKDLIDELSNAEGMAAVPVQGDASLLTLLMENMNQFPLDGVTSFNIIEP